MRFKSFFVGLLFISSIALGDSGLLCDLRVTDEGRESSQKSLKFFTEKAGKTALIAVAETFHGTESVSIGPDTVELFFKAVEPWMGYPAGVDRIARLNWLDRNHNLEAELEVTCEPKKTFFLRQTGKDYKKKLALDCIPFNN